MKRFYSTFIILLIACTGYGQAVLNEIYSFPSPTNHEFFELYNTSTSQDPVSVDGYTLVCYFDDGKDEGFYVLDLPNMSMLSKGYFVGSSAIPFNYQGNLNSTASNFSWNDPIFRAGLTSGYLKKWVQSTDNLFDGQPYYDEEVVPLNFNDFFSKKKGSGASFSTFVFREGIMVNSFLGGTGGSNIVPAYISTMPALNMDVVKAIGGTTTYPIDFANYTTTEAENVIQDIGTDNGYMRTRDGMCGTWEKSSAQAFHTPLATNGSASQMEIVGALTIDTHITRGLTELDPSFITYNITAGPSTMYPVELYIYADNGTVDDEWDAADQFLAANTETTVNDGPFVTYFTPQKQELIMVVKTDMGCYDQVRLILNPDPVFTALPIKLKLFTGKAVGTRSQLEWVASGNETGLRFEVEKSADGRTFTQAGVVITTANAGDEYYSFADNLSGDTYYRLKIVNKDNSISYSPVVFVKDGSTAPGKLLLLQNPVESSLVFTYQAAATEPTTINIYNALGVKLLSTQKTAYKGSNTYAVNLDPKFTSGTYILEVVSKNVRSVERFVRR
jgi:hypothetical protein